MIYNPKSIDKVAKYYSLIKPQNNLYIENIQIIEPSWKIHNEQIVINDQRFDINDEILKNNYKWTRGVHPCKVVHLIRHKIFTFI